VSEITRIKENTRKILEAMYGMFLYQSLKITYHERLDENRIKVSGSFQDWENKSHTYEIIFDNYFNALRSKID